MIRLLLPLLFLLSFVTAASAGAVDPALKTAIEAKDVAGVTAALANGADPNGTWMHDGGLAPALFHAISGDDPATVDALLAAKADANAKRNGDKFSALTHAAKLGNPRIVGALLDHGAVMEYLVPDGAQALSYAVSRGHLAAVELLVNRGAAIEARTAQSGTPLEVAVTWGQDACALFLLDRGADPLAIVRGESIWTLSIEKGRVAVVQRLLDDGIPVTKGETNGNPPVITAATHGQLEVLKLLVARGADLQAVGHASRVALTEAVWFGHAEVIDWLLDNGFDPDYQKFGNQPVLLLAAMNNKPASAKALLEHGASPVLWAPPSPSPWSEAVVNGREEIVDLMLDHGVDVSTGTDWGMPVWTAARQGYVGILRRLLEEEGGKAQLNWRHPQWGTTGLYEAVAIGNKEAVQALLEAGADPNLRREGREPESGMTGIPPLYKALLTKQHEVALLLLEHKADPNATAMDYAPPLYTTLYNDRYDMFVALLDHGADPNQTWDWRSMLSWTAYEDRPEYGIALLDRGANPNVQNRAGVWLTPLLAASYKGHLSLVEALIAHGADPFTIDYNCYDALAFAKDGGHDDVVQLLKDVVKAKESEGGKREDCALQRESDSDPESELDREEAAREAEYERQRAEAERQRNRN